MANRALNVPPAVQGVVVECGSYKGGSAANLSLVAALCGRRMVVFDSFDGIPEPGAADTEHPVMDLNQIHTYGRGAFNGSLEEVKRNITRHGVIEVCDFKAGQFAQSLSSFREKSVLVFADVDLRESLECCVRHLWPLLHDGCSFFTHEAHHSEIASLFFERDWWKRNVRDLPPGLVGAGCGLGLLPRQGRFGSALGYAVKNPPVADYEHVAQVG